MAPTPLKLFVSTPFRSFGTSAYFADAVFGAGEKTKGRYVGALLAEIESATQGMDDFVVDEVEFGFGPASGIPTTRLAEVLRALRSRLAFAPHVRIHALEVPGCLTVDFAGFCKNEGVEYLEVETLTTDVATLRSLKLPYLPEDTVEAFQVTYFTGAPALGIVLDAALGDGRALLHSATDAVGRSPLFVRLTHADDEALRVVAGVFEKHGLAPRGEGLFARDGFRGLPATHDHQLGLGLGAVSRLDGITFKTTGNLGLYLEKSANFEAIARQI